MRVDMGWLSVHMIHEHTRRAAEIGNLRQIAVGTAADTAPGRYAAACGGPCGRAFPKGVAIWRVHFASKRSEWGCLLAPVECDLSRGEDQRSVEVDDSLHGSRAGVVIQAS